MRRALGNRRKILVRNLPRGCGCQEVHDLLKDYELKYCYVDRNKRTAFVTLLDGDQARSAIRTFHQASFRGRDLVVQLQPTDALLCVTRLPQSLTLEEFEALVRTYGSIERCFLVYSEVTGLSKGYGFVEYMKKDAAARARLELLGKRLGPSALFAQWMDVNLLASERVHSRCLCVDQLPANYSDSGELLRCFSGVHTPVFCQLAQDEGRCAGGFAVVEYSSAQHAEEARQAASGLSIGGHTVQVSFCAPGAPGRSTLAALIAGQRSVQSGQKGLLPEPSPVQIMKGLSNPATLQVLLQPRQSTCAAKPVVLGGPPSLSQLISPPVTPTFLHLNQAHQSSLLPRVPSMSLAKLPLLKLEGIRTNNKPGLLGEPPALVLQTALGVGLALPLRREPGHPGETPKTLSLVPTPATLAAALGLLPFFPSQCSVGQAGPGLESVQEKHLATVGVIEGGLSGPQPCLQSFASLAARGLQAVQPRQPPQKQPAGAASEPLLLSADAFEKEAASQTQTSLLGEPPREIRLSRNPYLNLASVLPGVCLASAAGQVTLQTPGLVSTILDKCAPSCPPFGDSAQSSCWSRAQVAMHFDDHTSGAGFEAISSHRPESHRGLIRNPADTGAQAMCWQPAQPTPTFRSAESKDKGAAQVSPLRTEKRSSAYLLPSPEAAGDGGERAGQGMAVRYVETYLKKKRVS